MSPRHTERGQAFTASIARELGVMPMNGAVFEQDASVNQKRRAAAAAARENRPPLPTRLPPPPLPQTRAIRTDEPTRTMFRASELPAGAAPERFVHKRIIGAVGGFVTGGPTAAVAGFLGGGGGGRTTQPMFTGSNRGQGLGRQTSGGFISNIARRSINLAQTGCQPGFVFRNGKCERIGFRGIAQMVVPGGATGTQADIFGEAVVGAFGVPGLVPAFDSVPTLRCPPGTVLGRDDVCYRKGSIPMQFRKWRPGPKPFLSGGDRKCLLRADRLRKSKTSRRILRQLGMG